MADKHRQLYDLLKKDGYYSKSYDEFVKQFANPEKLVRLHSLMQADGLYTKTVDDFKQQFFAGITQTKAEDVSVIPIKDVRERDSITEQEVHPSKRLGGLIDTVFATEIIQKAVKRGIDPYLALAIPHQESGGFNKEWMDNPYMVPIKDPDELAKFEADRVGYALDYIKERMESAKRRGITDPATVIQAYNGLGKIDRGSFFGGAKAYGVDIPEEGINMKENPLYGKRIIDIRDNILKTNPGIVKLVDEVGKIK